MKMKARFGADSPLSRRPQGSEMVGAASTKPNAGGGADSGCRRPGRGNHTRCGGVAPADVAANAVATAFSKTLHAVASDEPTAVVTKFAAEKHRDLDESRHSLTLCSSPLLVGLGIALVDQC